MSPDDASLLDSEHVNSESDYYEEDDDGDAEDGDV